MRALAAASMTEPLFWTPDAIHELARQLHTSMLQFNDSVAIADALHQLPEGELNAWRTFRDQWADWYGKTTGATWIWSATVSTIEGFASKLTAWRAKYAQWTGKSAAGVDPAEIKAGIRIDTSGKQELDTSTTDWSPLWWGLGTLVVLGGGYWYWLNRNEASSGGRTKYAPVNWRSRAEKKYIEAQNATPTVRGKAAFAGLRKRR